MRHHVVITGTGRAGTSFLVQLLTHLGLETGFKIHDLKNGLDSTSKAGLEHDVREIGAPYIVKSPHFCNYAEEVLSSNEIILDHIFVPYRDIKKAALSRIRVVKENEYDQSRGLDQIPGGLWDTTDPNAQEAVLYGKLNRLLIAVANTHVRMTLLGFPKLAEDPVYCYRKLYPIIPTIELGDFRKKFAQVTQPEWIHSFS